MSGEVERAWPGGGGPSTALALLILGQLALGCAASPTSPHSPAPHEHGPPALVVEAPPACPAIGRASPPRVPYFDGDRWGFADRRGRVVIEPRWDAVEPFESGLARVRSGAGWGAIDLDGELRIPAVWAAIGPFDGELAEVRSEAGDVALVDACGEPRLGGPFVELDHAGPLIVAAREAAGGREWALLDRRGRARVDWSPAPIVRVWDDSYRVILADDGRSRHEQVLDESGTSLFEWHGRDLRFWWNGRDYALATDAHGRGCVLDRRGVERVPCGAYADFDTPIDRELPRLWAETADGWGLIDFGGDELRTLVPHRHAQPRVDADELTWVVDGGERVGFDLDGVPVERLPLDVIDHGALPPDCRGLARWLARPGPDASPSARALELLDHEGDVVEQVAARGDVVGHHVIVAASRASETVRDLCEPPDRALTIVGEWIELCAIAGRPAAVLAIVEQTDGGALVELASGESRASWRDGEGHCAGDHVELRLGERRSALALDGRELVPLGAHRIERRTIDGLSLLAFHRADARLYVGLDGIRYFADPAAAADRTPEARAEIERMITAGHP